MFDVNMEDVVTSPQPYGYTSLPMQLAYAGAGGMMQGAGKLLGFQDEEDQLKEIYDSADFSTEAGMADAVAKVSAISPEKGAELQKMLTDKAVGSAQLATANLATESAKLQNVMIKHGTRLTREFMMTPDAGGQKVTIGEFLISNLIDTGSYHPSTFTQAMKAIQEAYPNDSKMVTELRKDLKDQLALAKDNWVQAGALAIMEGEKAPDTYSMEETFNAELLSDDADWQAFLKYKESQKKNNKVSQTALGMANASSFGMGAS